MSSRVVIMMIIIALSSMLLSQVCGRVRYNSHHRSCPNTSLSDSDGSGGAELPTNNTPLWERENGNEGLNWA